MKKITLMPNPYRDRGYQITRSVEQLLRQSGAEVKICLPFHVDRSHELPRDLRFVSIEEALRECQGLICFGGDGTILHAARLVGSRCIPILGINTGSMGFMAELECNELPLVLKLVTGDYSLDTRMMIRVAVRRNGRTVFEDNALNDAVVTKGAVARVIQMGISTGSREHCGYANLRPQYVHSLSGAGKGAHGFYQNRADRQAQRIFVCGWRKGLPSQRRGRGDCYRVRTLN